MRSHHRVAPPLFDDVGRFDPSPATSEEGAFAFLNRVDTPFWETIRGTLEHGFARYPIEHADKLRTHFRSLLPGQHWGAWWELYLHELFLRLGYEIEIHPDLSDARGVPDFVLLRRDERLYVEAAVVFSGLVSSDDTGAPGWLLDAINLVRNPNFFVHVRSISRPGAERLKRREIVGPVQAWLDALDPDWVSMEFERDGVFPRRAIEPRGWRIELEAWPVRADARGKAGHRVLGAGPPETGWANDVEQLRGKLKKKAGRYGRPDAPLVFAVLSMSGFMDNLDIEQALFGTEAVLVSRDGPSDARVIRRRDGFWVRHDGPQNRRVSAVLTSVGVRPWNVRVAPRTWRNPWAQRPLGDIWPFSEATADETGRVTYRDATLDMCDMFALAPGWPGDEPFPRNRDDVA